MADIRDFIDDQADEDSDVDGTDLPPKKKARRALASSDEDEDEEEGQDDEAIRKELQGFVVDGDDEIDEGAEDKEEEEGSESEDEMDDISEEDIDLVQQNLGVKIKRKPGRIIRESDSEDEDKKPEEIVRQRIEKQLFEGGNEDDYEVDRPMSSRQQRPQHSTDVQSESEEGSGESDADDFIVDDDDNQRGSRMKPRRKHRGGVPDSALEEAKEIFGGDFDFEDFDVEEMEGEPEEEEDEYANEGEEAPVKMKPRKKKTLKTTLMEQIEPSELERGFLSEADRKIQLEDKPERFQLRAVPVTEAADSELEEEASWIFHNAFINLPTSMQEPHYEMKDPLSGQARIQEVVISKIREALNFMRNSVFEVPFIAFYRKEYVDPELHITDLWRIYHWDEKWCRMRSRKAHYTKLFNRMREYQYEILSANVDAPMPDDMRPLEKEDFDRIDKAQTTEELADVYAHFELYYGREIPKMFELERLKQERGEGGDLGVESSVASQQLLKQASRRDGYSICQAASLGGLAKKFGLTPALFADNLVHKYPVNEVEQYPMEPLEAARDYVNPQFPTPEDALKGAKYMVALQLAREPEVRKAIRSEYFDRAMICVRPTLRGRKEIDENHPIYGKRYLKNKVARDLEKDQFLSLVQAEENNLVKITISIDREGAESDNQKTFFEEIRSCYHKDEFSKNVQEWNNLRSETLKLCLENMLYPQFAKELKTKLLHEAREHVIKECCLKLYGYLNVSPYTAEQQDETEESRNGVRVMGVAYSADKELAPYCVVVDENGEMAGNAFLKVPNLLKRKDSQRGDERRLKEQDLEKIKELVQLKRPHVIALSAENRDALLVKSELETLVMEMENEGSLKRLIPVELVDNELSRIYMNSARAETDFRGYPLLLRQAVSLGRRLQDALLEFSQLCTPDEEILCLSLHSLQDQIPKDDLLSALSLEFINRVNEVGVDINRCLEHPHTASVLQFVCGLGPRKAAQLLKVLKQNDNLLESRTKLVTLCHMGPKVFMNCAGFIKIDTSRVAERTDAYIELLDGSRVHPETYEWARKMAVDALEWAEDDEANPAGALEEILESPEKLKDLDLDAFAEELERQGFGNKSITLYDIRAELNHRYKDLRNVYQSPKQEEIFNMLTKETPQTFNTGKLVLARVLGIASRAPQQEQIDSFQPEKNEFGQWWCKFCNKTNFLDLNAVFAHLDKKECNGRPAGVRVRLENGLNGFIPLKYLSDKALPDDPSEIVYPGQTIWCRVMNVKTDRFSVDLSCRTSDLKDEQWNFKPERDQMFDHDAEKIDNEVDEKARQKKNRQQEFVKRVIAHPSFHNVSYKVAETMLATMDQGEVIIRPSSKGPDRLTVSWKVYNNIIQHVDVREEGKENQFSIGRSLFIGTEEFEDLDEILARYVQPMASFARDLLNYKYNFDANGGDKALVTHKLLEEKQKTPSRIPYYTSASQKYPGQFLLSYLPRSNVIHEYITVVPEGYKYRNQVFRSIGHLFRWFKEHFREPIPAPHPVTATPGIDHQSFMAGSNIGMDLFTPRHPETSGFAPPTPGAQSQAGSSFSGARPGGYQATQFQEFGYGQPAPMMAMTQPQFPVGGMQPPHAYGSQPVWNAGQPQTYYEPDRFAVPNGFPPRNDVGQHRSSSRGGDMWGETVNSWSKPNDMGGGFGGGDAGDRGRGGFRGSRGGRGDFRGGRGGRGDFRGGRGRGDFRGGRGRGGFGGDDFRGRGRGGGFRGGRGSSSSGFDSSFGDDNGGKNETSATTTSGDFDSDFSSF